MRFAKKLLLFAFTFAQVCGLFLFVPAVAPVASAASIATPPELPRAYVDTTLPASSSSCTVTLQSGADLQVAINNAKLGDTICLQAGGTFTGAATTGKYVLTNKTTGSGWITIRTTTPDNQLPPPGTRVQPSDASKLAKVLQPGNNSPAFETEKGAHHYRLIGLEIAVPAGEKYVDDLVRLDGYYKNNNFTEPKSYSELPSYIVLDRVYLHGNSTGELINGLRMNCSECALIDSYMADVHSASFESHGILGWDGKGPFKIVNNYIEAAGINMMFGGGEPTIRWSATTTAVSTSSATLDQVNNLNVGDAVMFTAGGGTGDSSFTYIRSISGNAVRFDPLPVVPDLNSRVYWGATPADIEIRHNYFRKPLSWKSDDPSFAGQKWWVKNLFETKNEERILLDSNIFENSWIYGQAGEGIVVKSSNQGGNCPWCRTFDMTITNNIIHNVYDGMLISGAEGYLNGNKYPPAVNRVLWQNNIWYNDPNRLNFPDRPSRQFRILGAPHNIAFNHNTGFGSYNTLFPDTTTYPYKFNSDHFVFTNNIVERGAYGVCAGATEGTRCLNEAFSPYEWGKNLLMNSSTSFTNSYLQNIYPTSTLINTGIDSVFADYANRDLRLATNSPYKSAGTDGKDIGADVGAVLAATATAWTGSSSSGLPPIPTPTPTPSPASDTTPPVISGINASGITSSGATITWTTNELADTQVEYGTSTAYGLSSALAPGLVNSHSVILTGLASGATYHYRVKSRDFAGNVSVSADSTFTTAGAVPSSAFTSIRINAGGPAYTDSKGQAWSAEPAADPGINYSNTVVVAGTSDQPLYQTGRWYYKTMQYQFAVPSGSYRVTLKFNEPTWSKAGQRVFSVSANGQTVLPNFDIVNAAGGPNRAVDETFPVVVSSGQLTLLFSASVDNPYVSGIEITAWLAGDLNSDGAVNSLDYSILNQHWLQNYSQADLNADGLVNSLDFAILKSNYGK